MSHSPSAYLTAALRSRLIRAALSPDSAADIPFLLEELDLPVPESATPESLTAHLQSCLARLAREGLAVQLIRCCEGLAQFCLLQGENSSRALVEINQFLPPGLSFSLKSGRLLLNEAIFHAPDNPFLQESQQHMAAGKLLETLRESRLQETPAEPPVISSSEQTARSAVDENRQNKRQRIVSQRIHMLKHQLTGRLGP